MRTYTILMTFLLVVGLVLIIDTLDHTKFILARICELWIYGCITLNYYRVRFISP